MEHMPTFVTSRTFTWLSPIVLGLLLSLAYPPVSAAWLVWIIPGLLTLLLFLCAPEKRRGRFGFRVGAFAGIAFFLINLKWLWQQTGVGAVVLAIFLGLGWGVWGTFVTKVVRPLWLRGRHQQAFPRACYSLLVAALTASGWTTMEWLRGKGVLAFSWNGLGTAFAETPVIAQAADLVGVVGLSFLPVFVSVVLCQTVLHMRAEMQEGKLKPHLDFGVAILTIVIVFLYGVFRISQYSQDGKTGIGVVLVQQNLPQTIYADENGKSHDEIEADFARLTEEALSSIMDLAVEASGLGEAAEGHFEIPQADFVIWPEVALGEPFFFVSGGARALGLRNESFLTQQIAPLGEFTLITGLMENEMELKGDRYYGLPGGQVFNSMVAFDTNAQIETVYRKSHLVAFGEYIPFVEEIPLLKGIYKSVSGQEFPGNMDAGKSFEPITVQRGDGSVQFIPSICFEDTVPNHPRQFVRSEKQIILNITNDGWFHASEGGAQHMANARFRAIELRRPMIRCANAGVTSLISETGSIIPSLDGSPAAIESALGWTYGRISTEKANSLTLYALAGDWFCYLASFCMLLAAVLRWRSSRREKVN